MDFRGRLLVANVAVVVADVGDAAERTECEDEGRDGREQRVAEAEHEAAPEHALCRAIPVV